MNEKKKGGYRKIEFGELVRTSPETAATTIEEAWSIAGSSRKAAMRLNISRRSFFRFVAALRMLGFAIDVPTISTNAGIDTGRS